MPLTWGFCAWRSVLGLRDPADVVLACVDHDSEPHRGGRDSAERGRARRAHDLCGILVRRGPLGLSSIGQAFCWQWFAGLPRLCARDELPITSGRPCWRVVFDFGPCPRSCRRNPARVVPGHRGLLRTEQERACLLAGVASGRDAAMDVIAEPDRSADARA
jgi:hypothetical protein